ncbi:hypothetical protein [Aliamphritea spongicola]|nr:hypothetical protein [Aliamphritea spongicola]
MFEQLGSFRVASAKGGEIWTNDIFNVSRLEMERIIKAYNLDVINLGDGARINGTEYGDPSVLTITSCPVDQGS